METGLVTPSRPQWYVVGTKPRREQFAQDQLARREVLTFLPRIVEPARFDGREIVAPLFPGYLFVRIDIEEQYFDVAWTPGVTKFIGFGTLPSPLEDRVVDFLQERTGHEGILRAVPVFHPGERVRITHGPLEGLVGIIESPGSRRGRVRVLMELLRRQTRVEVPQQIVERISA